MRRRETFKIKQRAKLWAIYEKTNDGMELVREEIIATGKPKCEKNQVAILIAKGYVVSAMAYDDFVKNAKSEFVEEEKNNAD